MRRLFLVPLLLAASSCWTFGKLVPQADDRDIGTHSDVGADTHEGDDVGNDEVGDTGDTDDPADQDTMDLGGGDAGSCPPESAAIGDSAICRTVPEGDPNGGAPRIRVVTDPTMVYVASYVDGEATITADPWSRVGSNPSRATPLIDSEIVEPGATSAAVGLTGTGELVWVVTRTTADACAYVSGPVSTTTINCGSAGAPFLTGAEVVMAGGAPQYFWFEPSSGLISAMRHDSTFQGGAQVAVPWCISKAVSDCTPLHSDQIDSRSTGGDHVLLRAPSGAAYLWDTTQLNDDERMNECDCAASPPLPLTAGGLSVDFATSDVVWLASASEYRLLSPNGMTIRLHNIDLGTGAAGVGISGFGGDARPLVDAAADAQDVAIVRGDAVSRSIEGLNAGFGTEIDGQADAVAIAVMFPEVVVAELRSGVVYLYRVTAW